MSTFEFEEVLGHGLDLTMMRTPVPGGWMVLVGHQAFSESLDAGFPPAQAVFLPDPTGDWKEQQQELVEDEEQEQELLLPTTLEEAMDRKLVVHFDYPVKDSDWKTSRRSAVFFKPGPRDSQYYAWDTARKGLRLFSDYRMTDVKFTNIDGREYLPDPEEDE